jgi:hypothetical protein
MRPPAAPHSSQSSLVQSTKSSSVDLTAATAIFLLRNYNKFGLAERIFYHFDLTEALEKADPDSFPVEEEREQAASTTTDEKDGDHGMDDDESTGTTATDKGVCGVMRLLECAPVTPWQRFSSRQKKRLRGRARNFNVRADKIHERTDVSDNIHGSGRETVCYQPHVLPLRLNPSTRVYFGYETTRIVFCIDASASLTSTFGNKATGTRKSNDTAICPLDRIVGMAKTFFTSLIQPISSASMDSSWRPELNVSVLAVFPVGETSEVSLLVRDFLVNDEVSAGRLLEEMEDWVYSEVEFGISERLYRRRPDHPWMVPSYTSSMRQILEAGDYALSVLSSEARPFMVVATDCRSMSTDNVCDILTGIDRVDVPVHILDLSSSETHSMVDDGPSTRPITTSDDEMNFLTYDPGGPSCFPVRSTDDSAAVFGICRSTGGCFFDNQLLLEVSNSVAGQQPVIDTAAANPPQHHQHPSQPHFFRRRFVKMNGLQALTLFSLSPLSPTFHSSWGRLPPPLYLQRQFDKSSREKSSTNVLASQFSSMDSLDSSRHFPRLPSERIPDMVKRKQNMSHPRITFSRYVVSPIRIKALLLMRVKEGYRAKQYGQSTQEADKVFIQFTLSLEEFGTIYYELSYTAITTHNNLVGSANIKISIEAMNDRQQSFIHSVKDNFIQNNAILDGQLLTIRQRKSANLCRILRNIRQNDLLSSHLVPPSTWSDQLAAPDTPFVKRLSQLTAFQRNRHFQSMEFDVICSSGLFVRRGSTVNDHAVKNLLDTVSLWSDQHVAGNDAKFVKATSGLLTDYVVIMIIPRVSQLVTIHMEFFGDIDLRDRLKTVSSLKRRIKQSTQGEVLIKQMRYVECYL